jgi:hypothetical protein
VSAAAEPAAPRADRAAEPAAPRADRAAEPFRPDADQPDPQFEVLAVTPRLYTASPALDFDVHVSEPSGRRVYAIALSAQVMIEPARRSYDAETQARLEELFGPPDRWGATTRSLLWHQAQSLVGEFTGATTFRLAVPCSYDMELVAAKYFYALPAGQVPLAFNFNGTIHYRGDDGRLQISLVPWSATTGYRLDVGVWKALMAHHFPNRGWLGVSSETLDALQREKTRRALSTLDEVVAALLQERA